MTLKEFARKGGHARAAKLTKDERVRIARDAGLASAAKQRASKSIDHANVTSHVKTYKQPTEEKS